MTHTKHRKRRERADREEADRRLVDEHPIFTELRRALATPLSPRDPYWTTGRTGRAGSLHRDGGETRRPDVPPDESFRLG